MAKGGKQDEMTTVIVNKKVIKKGGGHHGGAWKVAYADFVTAMMAFFLLLWLLNVSTEDALEVISSYFDPSHPRVSDDRSGSGGVLGGLTMTKEGTMAESMTKPVPPQTSGYKRGEEATGEETSDQQLEQLEEELRQREQERFEEAKKAIEEALQKNEELKELAKHVKIDITPEGLRIQIIDQEGKPMFASGSADMLPHTRKIMATVANVIQTMPNEISIRGHTDAYKYAPGATYTNWELSADRANTARRVLLENSIARERLANVMGKADREHFVAEDPLDPRNRRISIILLNETLEQAFQRGAFDDQLDEDKAMQYEGNNPEKLPLINDNPMGTFQKTPGDVYFP